MNVRAASATKCSIRTIDRCRLMCSEALEPTIAYAERVIRAGSYVLEEELARGGFGVVYRARHEATALPAAVKVLGAGMSGDEVAIARFDREAKIVLSLAHPHVCEIFEHG